MCSCICTNCRVAIGTNLAIAIAIAIKDIGHVFSDLQPSCVCSNRCN